ncbi:O-antigen polymerase [Dactylosporangium sp. NPDC048998]|uniref:O-antigen polymerase n=1 Tax=Dactylosporangium sp. NPDC048998 TaxID=3363976 RepID=UPI003713AD1A
MTPPDGRQPRFRHAARQRPRASSVVAAVAGAAVIALLGVLLVLPHPTLAGALGLVAVAVCLTALYQVTFSGSFAPVAVTFWSFVTVWVGVAPLIQLRDNVMPWPDLPLRQYYVTAQIILLVAVVTYWAGYGRGEPALSVPRAPRFTVTIEKAIVVTGLAALLTAVCLPQTGGLVVRFTTRDDLQGAIKRAGLVDGKDQALAGLLSTLPAAVCLVALVLCLLCVRDRNHATPKARQILLATTAVAALLNIIYNNPLTANRFATFTVMLAAVFALVRFNRQLWRTLFSAGMLGGLAVVYPLANLFRNDKSRGSLRLGLDAYYTYDFDGFQQTVNSVYYVHAHGHTWGRHLISALLFFVPRSMWPGKSIAAGNVVAASRGYTFQNLALPFWAEVAVEFSIAGVVVVFFFYGRLAARLDRSVDSGRIGLLMAVAVLFAACQIGMLRGPLGAQIPLVGAAFGLLVVAVVGWRFRSWGLTRPPDPDDARGGARPAGRRIPAKAGA